MSNIFPKWWGPFLLSASKGVWKTCTRMLHSGAMAGIQTCYFSLFDNATKHNYETIKRHRTIDEQRIADIATHNHTVLEWKLVRLQKQQQIKLHMNVIPNVSHRHPARLQLQIHVHQLIGQIKMTHVCRLKCRIYSWYSLYSLLDAEHHHLLVVCNRPVFTGEATERNLLPLPSGQVTASQCWGHSRVAQCESIM